MRENTPPRVPDIDESDTEEIILDNYAEPDDDELFDDDMEEISMEELERRLRDSSASPELNNDVIDLAKLTFMQHSGPIFALSVHPNGELVATGAEDDKAIVWNMKTGEIIHTITDHSDSVVEVHFNHDGIYLFTGDMAGDLHVHKIYENDGNIYLRKIWSYSIGDMSWAFWHRSANILFAGTDNGEIYMLRVPSGECKIFPSHGHRCEIADLTPDGKKLFASYTTGQLKLWDLKNCSVIFEVDDQHPLAHNFCVNTVACHKDSPLFMSGDQAGTILFSTNNGPIGSVKADCHVEIIEFSPSKQLQLAASGTLNGQVAIWDYGKYTLRTICNHNIGDGITILKWISDYTLLVGTIEGNIYGFDARSGNQKFHLTGHIAQIYDFVYSPQTNMLVSVSEDCSAKVFELPHIDD